MSLVYLVLTLIFISFQSLASDCRSPCALKHNYKKSISEESLEKCINLEKRSNAQEICEQNSEGGIQIYGYQYCIAECENLTTQKKECESDSGTWQIDPSSMSSQHAVMTYIGQGSCKKKSDEKVVYSVACQSEYDKCLDLNSQKICQRMKDDCEQESTAGASKSLTPLAGKDPSVSVTSEKGVDQEALRLAYNNLYVGLQDLAARFIGICNDSIAEYHALCTPSKTTESSPIKVKKNQSVSANCGLLQEKAESVRSNISFKSEECEGYFRQIQCKEIVSDTGYGTYNGETATKTGDKELPENVASYNRIKATHEANMTNNTKSGSSYATLKKQADECVAAFGGGSKQPETASASAESTELTGSDYVKAKISEMAMQKLNDELAGGSSSSKSPRRNRRNRQGSLNRRRSRIPQNPFGSAPTSRTNGKKSTELAGGHQPSYKSNGGRTLSKNEKKPRRNSPSGASVSGSGQNTSAAGGGSGFGSGGSASASGGKKGRRSYRSAKARNLFLGFKKVRSKKGGASVSIKPTDYGRYGKATIQRKLASARKIHDKKLPLIFRNGKFVLDFLAMKESKEWKRKNIDMNRRMAGKDPVHIEHLKRFEREVNPDINVNIFDFMSRGIMMVAPDIASTPDYSKKFQKKRK